MLLPRADRLELLVPEFGELSVTALIVCVTKVELSLSVGAPGEDGSGAGQPIHHRTIH